MHPRWIQRRPSRRGGALVGAFHHDEGTDPLLGRERAEKVLVEGLLPLRELRGHDQARLRAREQRLRDRTLLGRVEEIDRVRQQDARRRLLAGPEVEAVNARIGDEGVAVILQVLGQSAIVDGDLGVGVPAGEGGTVGSSSSPQ